MKSRKGRNYHESGANSKHHNEIEQLLTSTIDERFHEPTSPQFLLVGRSQNYALGIGGTVRLTTSLGFDGIIPMTPNYSFIPAQIPMSHYAMAKSQYLMSANTSQIFVKLVGNNSALGDFTTFISINFTGGASGTAPNLRQAYINFRGFTLGQAWSTFTDLSSLSPTIDFQGPNAANQLLNYQIRYSHEFGKHWRLAAAAEMPNVGATYGSNSGAINQSVPDFILYGQYGWGEAQNHIRLSGLMRNMTYRDIIADDNKNNMGWAAQMSGNVNIFPKLKTYFQATYGEGYSEYINDFNSLQMDMVPNSDKFGEMQSLPMWAAYMGVKWTFCEKVFASATYSQTRIYSRDSYNVSSSYKIGQYVAGNIFWNLTSNCQLGAEYLYGRRINADHEKSTANRVNMMVQYNF